jgi:predicted membrane-bound mannosyltransferase
VHRGRGPFWTEGLILALAAVGLVAALRRRGLAVGETRSVRFLGFYTLTLMLVYSLIPYKTPWCLLGFLHGLILLAGVGAAELFRLARRPAVRLGLSLGLLAGLGHLGWQAFQASYRYADDQRNPYVYAHTLSDIFNLVDQVEAIARSQPAGYRLKVKVIAEGADYWPLPWYLRRFGTQAEWWSELHPDARAPVVIISARLAPALESRLGPAYQAAGFFGLRPSVFLRLYVESDVWQTYLQSLRQP